MVVKLLLTLLFLHAEATSSPMKAGTRLDRIAFGSCNQPVRYGMWEVIADMKPDKLILLGDNMYVDREVSKKKKKKSSIPEMISERYALFERDSEWLALLEQLKGWENVMATYDDHDYGQNNGNKNFRYREESKQLFFDWLHVPKDSPQRLQSGVYSSRTFPLHSGGASPSPFTYKVILVDTRSNKDPMGTNNGDFLGVEQWTWLENELEQSKADDIDLVFLGSSIQILPDDKIFEETWSEFPTQREKLLRRVVDLMRFTDVVLLSGDIHTAEILHAKCQVPNPQSQPNSTENQSRNPLPDYLIELTSSGLTHTFTMYGEFKPLLPEPNGANQTPPLVDLPRENRVRKRPIIFEWLYSYYQATLPSSFRKDPTGHHYQGLHAGVMDIIEHSVLDGLVLPEVQREVAVQIVDTQGRPVITHSIPLRSRSQRLSSSSAHLNSATETEDIAMASTRPVCQSFWPVSSGRKLFSKVLLNILVMIFVVIPGLLVVWFIFASLFYIFYGAETERRRRIEEAYHTVTKKKI